MTERDLVGEKVAVSMSGDKVMIEIICGDAYAAQVFFEDVVGRMQDGVDITLGLRKSVSRIGGAVYFDDPPNKRRGTDEN